MAGREQSLAVDLEAVDTKAVTLADLQRAIYWRIDEMKKSVENVMEMIHITDTQENRDHVFAILKEFANLTRQVAELEQNAAVRLSQ